MSINRTLRASETIQILIIYEANVMLKVKQLLSIQNVVQTQFDFLKRTVKSLYDDQQKNEGETSNGSFFF